MITKSKLISITDATTKLLTRDTLTILEESLIAAAKQGDRGYTWKAPHNIYVKEILDELKISGFEVNLTPRKDVFEITW